MDCLFTQECIVLGGCNIVEVPFVQGTVHCVERSYWCIYIFFNPMVVGSICESLFHVHEQAKVETTIVVLFCASQFGCIYAIHYWIKSSVGYVKVFGRLDVEWGSAYRRCNVASDFCVFVTKSPVLDFDGVGSCAFIIDEFSVVSGWIHHHVEHVERCRHAWLVVK